MAEAKDKPRDVKPPETGREGPQTGSEEHVPLGHDEMVLILEEIARDGSDTARIQAIKLLRQMANGDEGVEDDLERLIQTK